MLRKDPVSRPSIEQIMANPWFPKNQLKHFVDQFSQQKGIDKQIIEKMNEMGFDVSFLPQKLLSGEYSPLTAAYRQLFREVSIEKAAKEMDKILETSQEIPEINQMMPVIRPLGPRSLGMSFRRNRTMQVPFPVQLASRKLAGGCARSSTPCGQ